MNSESNIHSKKIIVRLFARLLCFVMLLGVIARANAQNNIVPLKLQLNDKKYLFVKFPSEVKYADLGSGKISATRVNDNIIKVKATGKDIEKSNISVVTTDGRYYSFVVEYNSNPSILALDMTNVQDSITSKNIIPSSHIEVSDIHTTHLILPTKVLEIAIGNEYVISEKAETIDNIVKVKSIVSDGKYFQETSITIVTINGDIYPMTVGYAKNPKEMSISFSERSNALFYDANDDTDNMKMMSAAIIEKGQYINDLGIEKDKMVFQLCSVFTNQDIIAFYLHAQNNSKIDYTIDFVKAYIADKKGEKYTITQEEELFPIYTYFSNDEKVIHGKDRIDIVFFYKKFTITDKRILNFELYEENGGRNLKFSAPNKTIINAKVMIKKD